MSVIKSTVMTTKVEFDFPVLGWTDITAYLDNESGLNWRHGVNPETRIPESSSASFTLDNSSEYWSTTNTSSPYFNRFRTGIGVRITTTYLAVPKVEFRGTIVDFKETVPDFGLAKFRVKVECEGLSRSLGDREYAMAKLENVDVDEALLAIAVAASLPAYQIGSTTTKLPVVIPSRGPAADMVGVALGEPGSLLYEDGYGLNFKPASSMTGGHASPAHTWGVTIFPENDLEPDWRLAAVFSRARVQLSKLEVSAVATELYRHPYSAAAGYPEKLAGGATRRITGRFDKYPATVSTKFEPVVIGFEHSGTSLYAAIEAADTTFMTNQGAGTRFLRGQQIKVDSEIMLITDVAAGPFTNQVLTVIRAQLNTIAVRHDAPSTPKKVIYVRSMDVTATPTFIYNDTSLTASTTSWRLRSDAGGGTLADQVKPRAGDILKWENEYVVCAVAPVSVNDPFTFIRGAYGSSAVGHAARLQASKVTFTPTVDKTAPTYIRASEDPSGIPADSPDITGTAAYTGGAHILVTNGNLFECAIWNSKSPDRWLSELVIGGTVTEAKDTPTKIMFEKSIPGVLGIAEGPEALLPFGAQDLDTAKGLAVGRLRAGRRPAPWLKVEFTCNVSANLSVRTASIGDLVRYIGVGTQREDIDEWYRIVAVAGWVDDVGLNHRTFLLMPSHLNRRADKCWYSDFTWRDDNGQLPGLGEFNVKGSGSAGWVNDSQWAFNPGSGAHALGQVPTAISTPAPALIDQGSGDHVASTQIMAWGNPANNSYPADTGGAGVAFRANSTGSQRWEARFNPTQSRIYLWNTASGTVASVAWTSTATPEIEVMVQGNRIRVYVDCAALPVIDVTSSTYQSNTYAGLCLSRTPASGNSGVQPTFADFYGQVI